MPSALPAPLFCVRGLSRRFPNGYMGLESVDLDIYESECLLIAGANGSGKTLLMRMLAGLTEPTGGTILYRGKPLAQWGAEIRPAIGLVFQDADAQIIGETVEEDIRFGPLNLKLPASEVTARVDSLLTKLGLAAKRDFPARRLSGGEKRRLAVAGVLALGCGTILLDEPFANLDWPGVVQVLSMIQELKAAGKTLVILTHELEKVLAFADRLVILQRGRVRDEGAPDTVLDRLQHDWGVRDPRRAYTNAGDCSWL